MSVEPDDPLAPLLAEYARTRDNATRDEIVLACMDLVEHVAHRYRFAGEPVEDITQEGYIGLINAVELFDLHRGVKFTTYAAHAVQGAIQHYLRDKGKLIREPGWLHDLNQKINKAVAALHQRLGREPTVPEIAAELNLPAQQIAEAVRSRDVFRVSSLEQPMGEDGDPGPHLAEREAPLSPLGGQEEFPIDDRLALEDALTTLREVERQVVHDFFFLGLSKTEIARKMSYSISHVSHILRRALKELKNHLLTEEREVMRRQLWSIEGQLEHYARRVREETITDDPGRLRRLRRRPGALRRGQRAGRVRAPHRLPRALRRAAVHPAPAADR
ncbi:MAG: sigma-70 family RNA polymerase sigma factor [Armatimonadetes bacterium]|nr:sigma-70 family RNA polymerase sigma factor [Armatimonadota bacterium]